jgi:hypothetical protein
MSSKASYLKWCTDISSLDLSALTNAGTKLTSDSIFQTTITSMDQFCKLHPENATIDNFIDFVLIILSRVVKNTDKSDQLPVNEILRLYNDIKKVFNRDQPIIKKVDEDTQKVTDENTKKVDEVVQKTDENVKKVDETIKEFNIDDVKDFAEAIVARYESYLQDIVYNWLLRAIRSTTSTVADYTKFKMQFSHILQNKFINRTINVNHCRSINHCTTFLYKMFYEEKIMSNGTDPYVNCLMKSIIDFKNIISFPVNSSID